MFLAFGRQTPHWGRPYIAHDSEEEAAYLADIAAAFVANAPFDPDAACANIALAVQAAWSTHSKLPRTDSNPNSWWNDDCQSAKDHYILHRTRTNLAAYNATTKRARQEFFMHKIDAMTTNNAPWEGIRWTKPRPPPKFSTILDNGRPIPDIASLFDVMHRHFSSARSHEVSDVFLDSIPQLEPRDWPPISPKEITDLLKLTSNASAPGPDNLTWYHLKLIASSEDVLVAGGLLRIIISAEGEGKK
ncbi:hypothetical protein AX14_004370 [Amanita brunnescens Koide BX004]|nr:hypothetical protein AX14_004370 [Amanita brunnescens Koide BX004]